jgi:hypothetical protein
MQLNPAKPPKLLPKIPILFLKPFFEEQSTLLYLTRDYDLLNIIRYIIKLRKNETLTATDLQDLKIPMDYKRISKLVDEAHSINSSNIKEFKELYEKADSIIAKSFGLKESQFAHIQKRLSSYPLDVLTPRWPWKVAAIRDIQEYDSDRFA